MSLHSYTVHYKCWNHRNRLKKKTHEKNNVCSESVFSLFSFARHFYRSLTLFVKRSHRFKNILASLARRLRMITNVRTPQRHWEYWGRAACWSLSSPTARNIFFLIYNVHFAMSSDTLLPTYAKVIWISSKSMISIKKKKL